MNDINYIRTVPEDKWKMVKISKNIEATGYKSMTYDYDFEKYPKGKINNDAVNLIIRTNSGEESLFELGIYGRKSLLKLKKVIDFALKIDKKGEKKEKNIPKNLEECFVELKKLLDSKDIKIMKKEKQEDVVLYHSGLGRTLRNDWKLWQDSPLSKWFNEQGIYHADDMSGIILDSFWRHLNNKPLMIKEQIKQYQEYWDKMKEKGNE